MINILNKISRKKLKSNHKLSKKKFGGGQGLSRPHIKQLPSHANSKNSDNNNNENSDNNENNENYKCYLYKVLFL